MITDLKPYPRMKDSGVPWLGEVPEHWEVKRFKYLLRKTDSRTNSGSEQLLQVSQYTGVTQRKRMNGESEPDTRAKSLIGYKQVRPGDLAVNIMLAWNGSMGVSPFNGIVSPAYCVYSFRANIEPWYYHYLLRSPAYKVRIKAASTGVVESRLRLYTDDLYRLEGLLPPHIEQTAIVRFLDHADRRIRRYIRGKQKLIALLEEQKQAIIHQAVTRGVNPEVTLKPTESSWFPLVPSHWNVMPMRRVVMKTVDGPHHSPDYLDQGIPFLSARNIKVDRWSFEDVKFISQSDYDIFCQRVKPEVGDVLYTKGGTTGVARFVDLDYPFQVWVHVAVLKLRRDLALPHWLAATLNSPRCYEQSQLFTRGATNQDLGLGRMKGIVLPVPPLSDQKAIAKQVIEIDDRIGRGIQAASREIELVTEYRTRLIADVVTGKLDVRKAVACLPDETETSQAMDRPEAHLLSTRT